MSEASNWIYLLTLALIGASVVDDLRSRKVHNSLVVSTFVLALIGALTLRGPQILPTVLVSIVAAFCFCLPLYLMRTLGGGDYKLLMAISPLMLWSEVGWTLVYSLVWGAILGVVMVLVQGQLGSFLKNLSSLARTKKVSRENLHKMPYTIAILLGFMTQVTMTKAGVSLL